MEHETPIFDEWAPRDLNDADIGLAFDSPIIDMGANKTKLYVVGGGRKRGPGGGVPLLRIRQPVDLPALRDAVPREDPRDICIRGMAARHRSWW